MSTERVRNEITRFLESEEILTLCLSGRWGVGKTHTWEALLGEAFKNDTVSPKMYAYASLFGLESLKDVRRTVFENTVGAAAFTDKKPLEATVASVSERLAQIGTKWRAGAGIIRGIPIVADYGGLTEAGFLDVRDQIVCFDDLERMSASLQVKDVFGLISLLKEKKRCKVVLLLNRDALEGQDAEDFRVQLEKVIDVNLEYNPSALEAVATAIPDRNTLRTKLVAKNAEMLEITNLRTIFKLLRICKRLEEVLVGYDERVIIQAFRSACLFAYALYQPKDAPPLQKLIQNRPNFRLLGDNEKQSPEQIQDSELLRRYGFYSADRFDLAVFECIRSGVYDEESVKPEADVIASKLAVQDKYAADNEVWEIYHGSFDDNADAFADQLKQSIKENAAAISPSNLSASIGMLKKLGHTEGLVEIIKAYTDSRVEGIDFWKGDPVSRFDFNDTDVAAAFAAKIGEFGDDRTLKDVAISIVKNRGWNRSDLDFIDRHSAEDFYNALKETKGEELRSMVYGLTYFRNVGSDDPKLPSISAKAVEALVRVGQESRINQLRVEKFGVVVPDA